MKLKLNCTISPKCIKTHPTFFSRKYRVEKKIVQLIEINININAATIATITLPSKLLGGPFKKYRNIRGIHDVQIYNMIILPRIRLDLIKLVDLMFVKRETKN